MSEITFNNPETGELFIRQLDESEYEVGRDENRVYTKRENMQTPEADFSATYDVRTGTKFVQLAVSTNVSLG